MSASADRGQPRAHTAPTTSWTDGARSAAGPVLARLATVSSRHTPLTVPTSQMRKLSHRDQRPKVMRPVGAACRSGRWPWARTQVKVTLRDKRWREVACLTYRRCQGGDRAAPARAGSSCPNVHLWSRRGHSDARARREDMAGARAPGTRVAAGLVTATTCPWGVGGPALRVPEPRPPPGDKGLPGRRGQLGAPGLPWLAERADRPPRPPGPASCCAWP